MMFWPCHEAETSGPVDQTPQNPGELPHPGSRYLSKVPGIYQKFQVFIKSTDGCSDLSKVLMGSVIYQNKMYHCWVPVLQTYWMVQLHDQLECSLRAKDCVTGISHRENPRKFSPGNFRHEKNLLTEFRRKFLFCIWDHGWLFYSMPGYCIT